MPEQELNDLGVQQRRVLEIVWRHGGATVQEVLDELNETSEGAKLAYTTVLTTMQKLEKAGWLTHRRSEESLRAYVYQAVRTREEAIGASLRAFAETFLEGSKTLLFQHFVNDAGLTEEELDAIRTMIAQRKSHTKPRNRPQGK